MSSTAASFFNRMARKDDIPHISNSVMELQQKLQDESSSSATLARAVKSDPMLTAAIVQAANGLKLSSSERIQSIEHAVTYVGRQTLRDILLIAAVRTFTLKTAVFGQEVFWREAFMIGSIAEKLARRFNPHLIPDEAYLAGCLVNIGKILSAIVEPQKTDTIYRSIHDPRQASNWRVAESKVGDLDHQVLGEIAATLWGFPIYVAQTIQEHHNLNKVLLKKPSTVPMNLSDIVAASVQLTHWVLGDAHQVDSTLIQRFRQRVDWDAAKLESFVEECLDLLAPISKLVAAA